MPLAILHHPDFQADLSPGHRFPMGKYGLIARFLTEDGLVGPGEFIVPEPIEFDQAARAHDAEYVRQVFTASVDGRIAREIGFDISPAVAMRARLSSSASLLAGRIALERGIATSTAGGSHHARRAQGAGFCVFNDVGIAAANLLAAGDAKRVLVLDCDVHQGDGTADIFHGEDRVATVSIHSEKNYPVRKVASDLDVGLPDDIGDEAYLEIVEDTLPKALSFGKPDLVYYNAGVDPHENDRLGRLALSDEGLAQRDRTVIAFFRAHKVPVVCVQGGGYSSDAAQAARRHTIIHHVAAEFA